MRCDLVTRRGDAPHHLGVMLRYPSQDEERARRAVALELREDAVDACTDAARETVPALAGHGVLEGIDLEMLFDVDREDMLDLAHPLHRVLAVRIGARELGGGGNTRSTAGSSSEATASARESAACSAVAPLGEPSSARSTGTITRTSASSVRPMIAASRSRFHFIRYSFATTRPRP